MAEMSLVNTELVSRFGLSDYVVFAGMLSVSAAIGIYYGFFGSKQKTTGEFLLGNRQMSIAPVALSLLASFLSAITLLGTPVEVYNYGTQYAAITIGYIGVITTASFMYLPVFYRLGVTSVYEYLEKRFSVGVRRFGSFVFILQMTMYMAIVTYAPALALSQVTGLHTWGSVFAIGIVCTFYTTVGGMKAVMWTDAFQIFVMFGSMLAVIIKGTLDQGGVVAVWQKNVEGQRIEFFNFDTNPLTRHTFWSLIIGGYFTWLAVYGVNQAQVQRYLTTPTMRKAQIALWWNLPGLSGLLLICCFGGLVLYAKYFDCDPLSVKLINTPDQLFPLFVMDTLGLYPGLPGLFVAGIFSGALSTVSSGLNSLAAVALEDFIKPLVNKDMDEGKATFVSKMMAVIFGVICLAFVAVAEQLGNVLQAALSIFGMVGGPLLGVFTLGMFFPWANKHGALLGLTSGFVLSFWIGIGAQVYKQTVPTAPISTAGCVEHFNQSNFVTMAPAANNNDEIFALYRVSYMWYSMIACITVVVVGLVVSFITGEQDPRKLNPKLISPFWEYIRLCVPAKHRRMAVFRIGEDYVKPEHCDCTKLPEKSSANGDYFNQNGINNYAYVSEKHPSPYLSKAKQNDHQENKSNGNGYHHSNGSSNNNNSTQF